MNSFSNFLKKIITVITTETVVRDFIMNYLKQELSITIDRKVIHLKKNTIEFKISPIIKSKILPHKEKILKQINNYLKEKEIQLIIKKII